MKVSAAAARKRRAEEGQRAYEEEQRQRARDADRAKHDPFGSRVPDHSVVHRYARCLSYPEWGVGSVNGIYFTGGDDDIQQWARVSFHLGVRTVPAGSLQFVDFSKPDPGAERVERFMTAAKHALAEGDFKLAARRLVYARDAEPRNTAVLRLMTLAFWQAGDLSAAARAARDWIREENDRPGAVPLRRAHLRGHGLAVAGRRRRRARGRRARRRDASAWERLGRLRLRTFDRAGARDALERARELGPTEQGLLDLALVAQPVPATSAPRSRPASRRRDRARVPGRLVALRARARPHRPRDATAWRRASGARARRRPRGPRPARARPRPAPRELTEAA